MECLFQPHREANAEFIFHTVGLVALLEILDDADCLCRIVRQRQL